MSSNSKKEVSVRNSEAIAIILGVHGLTSGFHTFVKTIVRISFVNSIFTWACSLFLLKGGNHDHRNKLHTHGTNCLEG